MCLSALIIRRQGTCVEKNRAMAQRNDRSLIRSAKRERREGRDCPVHGFYPAIAAGLTSRAQKLSAQQSYQPPVSASAAICAFDRASTEMMADFACTGFHSSSLPVSFSNIAIQIKRSYLSVVTKQEEFCCGPRQGN